MRALQTSLALVLSCLVIACGGDDDPMMMGGPYDGPLVNVRIQNTNAASDDPLPGVQVCIENFEGLGCQVSDEMGYVTIPSPANADVLYSMTGMGLFRGLHGRTTGPTDMEFEAEVAPVTIVNVTVASARMTLAPGTAHVLIRASAAPGPADAAGFSFALDPDPAMRTEVYFDESLVPTTELSETTTSGAAAFVNMDPGDYDLLVTSPMRSCAIEVGWGSDPTRIPFRAEADTLAIVHVDECM